MAASIRLGIALAICLVSSVAFHAVTQGGTPAKIPLAGPGVHAFPPHSAALYRLSAAGDALLALDASSLADREHHTFSTDLRPSTSQFTSVLPSADGSRFLVVHQLPSHAGAARPSDTTLQLFESRTGKPIAPSHHPAVVVAITGVSADGMLAYGLSVPNSNTWCGPGQFYVLNSLTGVVVRHVTVGATFFTPVLVDPGLRYLYALTMNDSLGPCGSGNARHPTLSAYDLRTGALAHRVVLSSVVAGQWRTSRTVSGSPVIADWTPGFALSPDGTQIAILDGHGTTLTLLAAPSLRIEGTESVIRQTSGLEEIAAVLGLSPAVAEAKGQSQGTSLQIEYMPQGRSLLVTGTRFLPDSKHPVGRAESLGIWLIDIAGGRIEASLPDSRRIMGVWPAPDASGIYSVAEAWHKEQGWLAILRRHDPASLRVTATRTFTHTSWLPLVFLRGR